MTRQQNRRVLIIDDLPSIHDDFRKILGSSGEEDALAELEQALFGKQEHQGNALRFEIDSAYQGQEGLACVERSLAAGQRYAMAFVDVRMPPGWDGIETATRIWEACPDLQVVICTAYTDYSWQDMMRRLGAADRWVILKKPFDNIEVLQLACALTEKWNLNQQAHLKLSEMEGMVAERTQELCATHRRLLQAAEVRLHMEQQLIQARKLQSVAQLAAGVAHHFNNLLQVIVGNCHWILSEASLCPDHVQALEDVLEGSKRGAALTRQLIDFSSQKLLRLKPTDLNAAVADIAERLRRELSEGVSVNFTPAPELPKIPVDAALLERVLSILARNAQDAMDRHGKIDIKIILTDIESGHFDGREIVTAGRYACLSVSDTGAGMDNETLSRLFEPFFTTKGLAEGVGLGLATAYGIVKQHRGWLDVNTEQNAGTTFRIYLPAATESVTPECVNPVPVSLPTMTYS